VREPALVRGMHAVVDDNPDVTYSPPARQLVRFSPFCHKYKEYLSFANFHAEDLVGGL